METLTVLDNKCINPWGNIVSSSSFEYWLLCHRLTLECSYRTGQSSAVCRWPCSGCTAWWRACCCDRCSQRWGRSDSIAPTPPWTCISAKRMKRSPAFLQLAEKKFWCLDYFYAKSAFALLYSLKITISLEDYWSCRFVKEFAQFTKELKKIKSYKLLTTSYCGTV